jgi:hypothetical protein
MSYPYFDLVQQAHADLKAEGLIKPRDNQDAIEQDKGLLTRRAAWYVHTERDGSHGLLAKPSGNNSLGYSVDWMLRNTDGEGWDVATDDGTQALPSNGGPYGPDPARIPDWRPPTAELAQMPDEGGVEPGPEPIPPAADRTDEVLQAIAASEARITAHTTAEADRVIQRLNELRQEVIDFGEAAGKVLLLKRWLDRHPEDEA